MDHLTRLIGCRWFAAALAKVPRFVLRNSLIRSASFVRSLDFACLTDDLLRYFLPVVWLAICIGTTLLMYCENAEHQRLPMPCDQLRVPLGNNAPSFGIIDDWYLLEAILLAPILNITG